MATGSGINVGDTTGAKAQNAEWFGTDLSPINPASVTDKPTTFVLQISLSAAVVVEVTLDSGSNWTSLNENNTLVADALYRFKIGLRNGDLFNVRIPTAGGATVDIGRVDEYPEEA